MTLVPLLHAPFVIQLHVLAALCAIVVGPMVLWRRSRDVWHKYLGYLWVCAMTVTALSSFYISETPMLGPFGPIHALSLFTLFNLWRGVNAARMGRIVAHRRTMQGLYFWAMGVAGLFTFLPNRRMNDIFFADAPLVGFILMAIIIGAGLTWYTFANRDVAAS